MKSDKVNKATNMFSVYNLCKDVEDRKNEVPSNSPVLKELTLYLGK